MNTEQNSTVETLRTILIELSDINQRVHGVIHPDIHDKLTQLYAMAEKELAPIMQAEKNSWDDNHNSLKALQKKHQLRSIWSVTKVAASDMNKKTPLLSKITYQSWGPTQTHTFNEPTEITWLELWKIADKLIRDSGDEHHIFIESLYRSTCTGSTEYYLSTGS